MEGNCHVIESKVKSEGRWEYLKAIYERYRKAGRKAKKVILDEFCENTGYHRQYATRGLTLWKGPSRLRGAQILQSPRQSSCSVGLRIPVHKTRARVREIHGRHSVRLSK